jgi:replicative DNA helicase
MGHRVTPITLMSDAQDAVIGEGITARQMIQRLSDEAPTDPGLIIELAKQVRDCAIRRSMITTAQMMMTEAQAAPVSVTSEELRFKYDEAFAALFRGAQDLGLRQLYDVNASTLERLKQPEQSAGLELSFRPLADLIGPLMPGRFYVLGGGPGSGKSALLLQVLRDLCQHGFQAALYTPEMDEDEVGERALASDSGVDAGDIETGGRKIRNSDYEVLWEAHEKMRVEGLWIDQDSAPSVAGIRGRSQRKKRLGGLDVIGIDHVHYLSPANPRQQGFEALDENLKGLKRLAKDLAIPVIGVVQLGTEALRDMAKWPHRPPTQGDVLYSGVVERHVDVIVLLHREEYLLARNKPAEVRGGPTVGEWDARQLHPDVRGRAELILAKRRGGLGFGRRNVGFEAKRFRFNDSKRSIVDQVAPDGELDLVRT